MKTYNHKQVLNLLHSCTQVSPDVQDKGITPNRLKQIIEILEDCNCQVACQQLIPGFVAALGFVELGDARGASVSLSVTVEKIGLLSIPQNFLAQ